jgi:hypothetical protein
MRSHVLDVLRSIFCYAGKFYTVYLNNFEEIRDEIVFNESKFDFKKV